MAIEFYDIQGALTVSVEAHSRTPLDRWLTTVPMELEYFRRKEPTAVDLAIEIGEFRPTLERCLKSGDSTWVRPGYLYFELRRKTARVRADISIQPGSPIRLRIDGNALGNHLSFGQVVEPVFSILLERSGLAKIHASGVALDKRSSIFAGLGGSGKTTIALELVKQGYEFLGDDALILREDTVLPFPKWLHVFRYRLDHKTPFDESLSTREKGITYLTWLLANSTFGYAKVFTFLRPGNRELGLRISSACPISNLFVLHPGGTEIKITEVSPSEAATYVAANDMCELMPILPALFAYAFVTPGADFGLSFEHHRALVESSLSRAHCYLAQYPQVDRNVVQSIVDIIGGSR